MLSGNGEPGRTIDRRGGCEQREQPLLRGLQLRVGEQEDVRVHARVVVGEHLERHPQLRCAHGDEQRHAVTRPQAALLRSGGVVLGRHEDGAALRVAEQVVLRLRRQQEPVVLAPLDHGLAAALEHGDVERLDLHLLDDDGGRRRGHRRPGIEGKDLGRVELALEALQGPPPRGLDARGNRGQRHDPPNVRAGARVRKARDVVLDTAAPCDERRRLVEANVAVGRHQTAAGKGRDRLQNEHRGHPATGYEQPAHRVFLLDV